MTEREALDKLMAGMDNIVDFEEALEVLNNMVNSPKDVSRLEEGNSMWEQRYREVRDAYERRWGDYRRPDTVRNVVDESIRSGFTREDAYQGEPPSLDDLNMSFDARTE